MQMNRGYFPLKCANPTTVKTDTIRTTFPPRNSAFFTSLPPPPPYACSVATRSTDNTELNWMLCTDYVPPWQGLREQTGRFQFKNLSSSMDVSWNISCLINEPRMIGCSVSLKRYGRKRLWRTWHLPEQTEENYTVYLNQDSRSPGRHSNLGPPEYKAGALITLLRRSVGCIREAHAVRRQITTLTVAQSKLLYIYIYPMEWLNQE
jgi:hypothetical protein